jgi:hypothetical protein
MKIYKFLIAFTFLLLSTIELKAQTFLYSYTDPCTGLLKSLTVPTNGVTVTYFGQIQTFNPVDFQNGVFEEWSNGVLSTYGNANPCGSVIGVGTSVDIAQGSAINFISIINNISALSELQSAMGGGSLNTMSVIESAKSASGKKDKKDKNKNNTTNSNIESGSNSNQSNENGQSGNSGSNTSQNSNGQNGGESGSSGQNSSNQNQSGVSNNNSENTTGNNQNSTNGSSSQTSSQNSEGNQTTSNGQSQSNSNENGNLSTQSGEGGQNQGGENGGGPINSTGQLNQSLSGATQTGQNEEGNNSQNNQSSQNSTSENAQNENGQSSQNNQNSNSTNNSENSSQNSSESSNTQNSSSNQTGSQGSNGGSGSSQESNGNPPNGSESATETTEEKKINSLGGTVNSTQKSTESNKPQIVLSSDFAGFNFKDKEVSFGGKGTAGYTSMRWDGRRSYGLLLDYTSVIKGPNLTGFWANMAKRRIDLISVTATISFNGRGSQYGTLALGQMWSFPKVKNLKAIYLATGSFGNVYGEKFLGTAAIAGGMYDWKVSKRIDIKLMNLFIYAPYVSYYNDILLKSPYVIMPIIGTNIGITKKFKFNVNFGGAYAIKQNVMNFTLMFGTRLAI